MCTCIYTIMWLSSIIPSAAWAGCTHSCFCQSLALIWKADCRQDRPAAVQDAAAMSLPGVQRSEML